MRRRRPAYMAGAAVALAAACLPCVSEAVESAASNLADLSLEQLGNIQISSVSRRSEPLQDAAASVFVITADQIHRSGARTLPEALRLAPNLEVARTNANGYAISARGFNSAGNKLLVLIDGRIIYTPLYSGVLWDAQDVMLEDVLRIEVISGPGGTLWGSNAVNGVINVITRSAEATQGGLVSLGAAGREKTGAARYGGALGAGGHYRLYMRGADEGNTRRANGQAVHDAWNRQQAGIRADWGRADDGVTLQGDAYQAKGQQVSGAADQDLTGFNLLARWTRSMSNGDRLQLQAYFDQTERRAPGTGGTFAEQLKTSDISFQDTLAARGDHALVWGGGYRFSRDDIQNIPAVGFLPAKRGLEWINLFLQDEITLSKKLTFTAGAKVERNPYTGTEILPSARLAWKPSSNQLLWSAVSRAVRTPSRLDRELYSPTTPMAPPAAPFAIAGGPNFKSEVSKVIELGWRAQPTAQHSYSVTLFHHIYTHLRSVELRRDPAYTTPYYIVGNEMRGHSNGVEAWGNFQLPEKWLLSIGGFLLDQKLSMSPQSTDPNGTPAAGNDPKRQLMVRLSKDLPQGVQLQVGLRHVGALPSPAVPGYTLFDGRIGWRINPNVEAALTVQNLFDRRHVEFGNLANASEFERRAFANVTWKF